MTGIERFLSAHIRSLNALETLLFLRGHADRPWRSEELAQALRSNAESLEQTLARFAAHGLLTQEANGYRYAPEPADDQALAELDRMLKERPFALMTLILAAPNENLRSFSDAFSLRKD